MNNWRKVLSWNVKDYLQTEFQFMEKLSSVIENADAKDGITYTFGGYYTDVDELIQKAKMFHKDNIAKLLSVLKHYAEKNQKYCDSLNNVGEGEAWEKMDMEGEDVYLNDEAFVTFSQLEEIVNNYFEDYEESPDRIIDDLEDEGLRPLGNWKEVLK